MDEVEAPVLVRTGAGALVPTANLRLLRRLNARRSRYSRWFLLGLIITPPRRSRIRKPQAEPAPMIAQIAQHFAQRTMLINAIRGHCAELGLVRAE